jgi:hypothetical protein
MLLCDKIKIVINISFLRENSGPTGPLPMVGESDKIPHLYEERAAKSLGPRSVQTLNPALLP